MTESKMSCRRTNFSQEEEWVLGESTQEIKNIPVKSECRVERSWQQSLMGNRIRLHNLLDTVERKERGNSR